MCFFIIIYFLNVIDSSDVKAEFSASSLQSSVSHDPSEMILICWFAAQETFLIIINVENSFNTAIDLMCPSWIISLKKDTTFER